MAFEKIFWQMAFEKEFFLQTLVNFDSNMMFWSVILVTWWSSNMPIFTRSPRFLFLNLIPLNLLYSCQLYIVQSILLNIFVGYFVEYFVDCFVKYFVEYFVDCFVEY